MTSKSSSPQSQLRRHGGRLLAYPSFEKATMKSFSSENVAIFIHGFTANSVYMRELMHQFEGAGFSCFAFEYPSDRGIDSAAKQLRELLEIYDADGTLSRRKAVLVGHSMGGLVARAFVNLERGDRFVQTVIALGSPNRGTLKNSRTLEYLVAWGEGVSGINPSAFVAECASARQLLGLDGTATQKPFIEKINDTPSPPGVIYHSISGGLARLEFGKNPIRNMLANAFLARHLSKPHDGLVEEESSNLSGGNFTVAAPGCEHHATYVDYPATNHSHLVNNQTVAVLALRCALGQTLPAADGQEVQAALEKARTSSQGVRPPT